MIRINLLPSEYRVKPKSLPLPNLVSTIVYGLIILMFVVGGLMMFAQSRMLGSLNARADALAAEETRLAAQTRLIDQLEVRQAMLAERLGLLDRLEDSRFENVTWLNTLNRTLPKELWLVATARNRAGDRTTIEGLAEGYRPIADLMSAMEVTGRWGDVQLVQAERSPGSNDAKIHFTVSAAWQGDGPAPTAVAEKGKEVKR